MLPKLEYQTHETTLPYSRKVVSFRAYQVREEKILMMAVESEDSKAMLKAIIDIVEACTFRKVEVQDLFVTDLEYLFLQIRMKSVGETVELKPEDAAAPVLVDLSKVIMVMPEGMTPAKNVDLTPGVGITLRPFLVSDVVQYMGSGDKADPIETILCAMDCIYDSAGAVYKKSASTPAELKEFVETFSTHSVTEIAEYISKFPTLQLEVAYKTSGGKDTKITLKGLKDFFG